MRGISILDFDCCDVREDELRHLPHCACVRRTRVYRNHIYPASERGMRKCVKIRSKSGQKRVNAFIITYKSMLPQIGKKLIDKERMSSSILIPATNSKPLKGNALWCIAFSGYENSASVLSPRLRWRKKKNA